MNIEDKIGQLIPHDKALHLIAGVVIYAITHMIWVVVGAAILKELYDRKTPSDFDWQDAAFTLAGGVLGILCGVHL